MSNPRIPTQDGAAPWGQSDPRQGGQPYAEQLGSLAHPQSQYPQPQYPQAQHPQPQYPQHPQAHYSAPAFPVASEQYGAKPGDERRDQPRKRLPEPPAGRAAAVIVVAWCILFVELVELAILLVTSDRGETQGGIGAGAGFDINGLIVTGLYLLAALLVTGSWLRASRQFAEAANPAAQFARRAGWTWFGWLVPVVFLWFPYQMVRDVRRAVVPDGGRRAGLGWWWICWLLFGLLAYSPAPADLEVFLRSGAAIALLVAFVQWNRIVRETTRAQERLAGLS